VPAVPRSGGSWVVGPARLRRPDDYAREGAVPRPALVLAAGGPPTGPRLYVLV